MSKIRIEALGGMGENGKNMYLVEVDQQIFVLDAGLIYPQIDLYGIDAVVPNIDYLIENQERIAGIFISHGHDDHIGALPYLLKNIKTKVFGTHFTISLIETLLKGDGLNISDYKLFRINSNKTLKFGNVQVSFFNVNHALPDSSGIIIHTKDGDIVYATDFNFSKALNERYKISYDKILELSKNKVLAVMAESVGISDYNRTTNDQRYEIDIYNSFIKDYKNIYIACYSTDVSRIQQITNLAVKLGKKIAVVSRKHEQIIKTAIETGYLDIPHDSFVELDGTITENLVVFVVGNFTDPYYLISRMINGQVKNVKINQDDLIIGLSDALGGTEKYVLHVLDEIYRKDINYLPIENKILRTSHATKDDLTQLYAISKPKYIIPIKGEERHLSRHLDLLEELGYDNEILDLTDGKVIEFVDGKFTNYSEIKIGEVYVDCTLTGSVNEEIVNERNLLATDGVVEVVVYIDSKNKKIVKPANIITKGFVYTVFKEEDLENLKHTVSNVIEAYFKKKKIVMSDLESAINHELKKGIRKIIKTSTMIIPIVVDLKNIKY